MRSCLFCTLASLLLLSASCAPNAPKTKDSIVGKWEDEESTSLMIEFTKDGTLTLTDKRNEPRSGKYTITEDNQVSVDDPSNKIPKMTFKVTVTADNLTTTDFNSESRIISFHEGKILYSFPPGGEDGKRRNQIKFKRLK